MPLVYRAPKPDNVVPWHYRARAHGGATQSIVRSEGDLDGRAGGAYARTEKLSMVHVLDRVSRSGPMERLKVEYQHDDRPEHRQLT